MRRCDSTKQWHKNPRVELGYFLRQMVHCAHITPRRRIDCQIPCILQNYTWDVHQLALKHAFVQHDSAQACPRITGRGRRFLKQLKGDFT